MAKSFGTNASPVHSTNSYTDRIYVMEDNTKPQDVAPTEVPVPEVSPEVKDFYDRYKLALANWFLTHPNQKPPIYVDPIDGKMKWGNRDMRKRVQKEKMRARKHR